MIETERKYLIETPDFSRLADMDGYSLKNFSQTYLSAPKGVTRRVRRSESEEGVTYIYNEKRRISPISCIEDEHEITKETYESLLCEKEAGTETVEKTKRTFLFLGQLFEVDTYPSCADVSVCETELKREDEHAVFPDFIKIIREVSGEKGYSNHAMSKRLFEGKGVFDV